MTSQVSVFRSVKDSSKPIQTMGIREVLFSEKNKQKIELLRMLPKDSVEFNEIKESLPCCTPSGTFSVRNSTGVIKHSGTICVEWDHVNDPEALKDKIKEYPFIWYAGLSCSGRGVFALIDVEQPERHSEYFRAMRQFFDDEGIPLDPIGSDVTRLRVASYDERAYLNNFAQSWSKVLPPVPIREYTRREYNSESIDQKLFLCGLDYIEKYAIDITAGRTNWLSLGSTIKTLFGAVGEDHFVALSRYHLKFKETEARRTWQTLRSGGYGIGVFCAACTRAGVPNLNEIFAGYIRNGGHYE